jgi:hypothetical protein
MLRATLGLFGLLLLSPGARAQVTTFDVTNPNASEGAWQVVVTQTGDAFSVNVSATSTLAAPKPGSDGDEVTVTILDKANNVMTAINDGGGVVGNHAGPWTNIANGNTIEWKWFTSLFPPVYPLDNGGSNQFLGDLTVSPNPGETSGYIDVTVYDSINGPWTETESLTPEASSLALLVPGLIPLGFMLRKRRARAPNSS